MLIHKENAQIEIFNSLTTLGNRKYCDRAKFLLIFQRWLRTRLTNIIIGK